MKKYGLVLLLCCVSWLVPLTPNAEAATGCCDCECMYFDAIPEPGWRCVTFFKPSYSECILFYLAGEPYCRYGNLCPESAEELPR